MVSLVRLIAGVGEAGEVLEKASGSRRAFLGIPALVAAIAGCSAKDEFDYKEHEKYTLQELLSMVKKQPDDGKINFLLAEKYFRMGSTSVRKDVHTSEDFDRARTFRLGKAEHYFQQALRLNPGLWMGHRDIARLYDEQGQYSKALSSMEKALETNPYSTHRLRREILSDLAEFHCHVKQYPLAIERSRQAVEMMKKIGTSKASISIQYWRCGYFEYVSGNLDQAIKDLRTAAQLNPKDPDPHKGLGYVFEKRGEDITAAEEFTKAAKLSERNPRELVVTIALYEKAIELDPQNEVARRSLERLLQKKPSNR